MKRCGVSFVIMELNTKEITESLAMIEMQLSYLSADLIRAKGSDDKRERAVRNAENQSAKAIRAVVNTRKQVSSL